MNVANGMEARNKLSKRCIGKKSISVIYPKEVPQDKVLAQMKAKHAGEQVTDIDGVKIDFPAEWVHLRKSNTEPIIRIYSESRDKAAADALAEKIIGEIRAIVAK